MSKFDYIVSREDCQKKCEGRVCEGCGWEIEPLETVDNGNRPTHWAGCTRCCRFTSGTTASVYDIGEALVSGRHFNPYSFKTTHEEMVSEASRVVEFVLKKHKEG